MVRALVVGGSSGRVTSPPALSLFIAVILLTHLAPGQSWWPSRHLQPTAAAAPPKKVILLYDHFYSEHRSFVKESFDFNMCSETKCAVTQDRSRLVSSDAVWFHSPMAPQRQEMVQLRAASRTSTERQYWIWANVETPTKGEDTMGKMDGLFNLTSTYRLDSDILLAYNEFRRLPPPGLPQWRERALQWFHQKEKGVAWTVSHCETNSRREDYVKLLREHLAVDVFGGCPGSQGQPQHHEFTQMVRSHYKFYLAFEHSLCKDYITEKMWFQALNNYAIPVVRGGKEKGEYHKVAPPGSFIDARDFATPADLAAYINKVASDEHLFLSYHQWREFYELRMSSTTTWHESKEQEMLSMCYMCSFLHAHDPATDKFHADLRQHWTYASMCTDPTDV